MPPDDLLRTALDHTLAGVRAPLEAGFRAFADELHRLAAAEREQAIHEAAETATAQARQHGEAQLVAQQQAADERIAGMQRAADERLESARRSFEADAAAARSAAEAEIGRIREEAQAQIAEIRAHYDAERDALQRRVKDEIDAAAAASSREVEEARRESDEARRVARASHELSDDLRRQLDTARTEVEQARVLRGVHESVLHDTRVLLDGVRSLDEARALGEVLHRLVQLHRRDDERMAVFVLRGDRLQQWETAGFSGSESSEKMEVSIGQAGLLTDVVRTGRASSRPAEGAAGPFPADAEGRAAAALPITVGGAVVAVLYVDTSRHEASDARWPAIFEVLARHASRVLEAITIQRAAGLLPPAGVGRAAGMRQEGSLQ